MQHKLVTARVASLVVRILDIERPAAADKPRALVVLCHGYGAPGHDLVGIGAELLTTTEGPRGAGQVRFAFPEAPLALPGMDGRAWWHIDIGRFQQAATTGDIAPLLDEVPEGLPAARKALMATVDELVRVSGVPMSRVVLGGFSQGAMVMTDVGLRLEEAPAALAIMSGALLCRPEWTRLADKRRGLRVLQSHGAQDPILPYAVALELKKLLDSAGLKVDFTSFKGGHGIDGSVVKKLAALIDATAA
jgi:phospholipase/carboxylesterase